MAEPGWLGTARLAGSSRGLMAGPELAQGTFEIDDQVLFLKLPPKDFHSEVEGRKGAAAPVTQALLTLPQLLSRPDGQGKRVQMGVGRVRAPQGAKLLLLCPMALLTRVHGMPSWSLDSVSVLCSLRVPDSSLSTPPGQQPDSRAFRSKGIVLCQIRFHNCFSVNSFLHRKASII